MRLYLRYAAYVLAAVLLTWAAWVSVEVHAGRRAALTARTGQFATCAVAGGD